MLAWKVQAQVRGGLDGATERKLRDIASTLERDGTYRPKRQRSLSPGVVVTREWKGVVHKVSIVAGGFEYRGQLFKSRSEIARAITGTRWSEPRFFGLEQKPASKSKKAVP